MTIGAAETNTSLDLMFTNPHFWNVSWSYPPLVIKYPVIVPSSPHVQRGMVADPIPRYQSNIPSGICRRLRWIFFGRAFPPQKKWRLTQNHQGSIVNNWNPINLGEPLRKPPPIGGMNSSHLFERIPGPSSGPDRPGWPRKRRAADGGVATSDPNPHRKSVERSKKVEII